MITALYYAGFIVLIFLTVLIIYLVSFIKTLNKKVTEVEKVIKNLEINLNVIADESTSLLQSTSNLVVDLKEKSARMNNVVEAFGSVGDAALELKQLLTNSLTSLNKASPGNVKVATGESDPDLDNNHNHFKKLTKNKTLIQKLTALALTIKAGMEIWQRDN